MKKSKVQRIKTTNFTDKELDLFKRHAPCLLYDLHETFYPVRVGLSLYRDKAMPPSLKDFFRIRHKGVMFMEVIKNILRTLIYDKPFRIYKLWNNRLQPTLMTINNGWKKRRAHKVLEYAVYYDSDISHIYELEHVWMYLDNKDELIGVKATRHGTVVTQYPTPESIKFHRNHAILHVSPGKHAYYPNPSILNRKILTHMCNTHVCNRVMDVQFLKHEDWLRILPHYPGKEKIAESFKKRYSFTPSFKFNSFMIPGQQNSELLVPWDDLEKEVPERIIAFLDQL